MNNKPVAWIDPYDLERLPHYDCHIGSQQLKNGVPLYTYQQITPSVLIKASDPVYPVKDLTDEEIMDIKTLMEINYGCVPPLEFAWAILKKAQEK